MKKFRKYCVGRITRSPKTGAISGSTKWTLFQQKFKKKKNEFRKWSTKYNKTVTTSFQFKSWENLQIAPTLHSNKNKNMIFTKK